MPWRDREKFNKYRNAWVKRRREFWDLLKEKPCTDCVVQYPPYVMQWDHITDDKNFTIGSNWQFGIDRILAEIEKCELVCANCHAERTHRRACVPE